MIAQAFAILELMEVKDLSEIHYADYNPRILSDHMGAALDASMTTFGDISGITANLETNTLITGHQRLKVLQKRYPHRVKIYIEHRFDTPDEYGTVAVGFVGVEGTDLRLAYREVRWPREKEMAANIGANKIEADFDDGLLAKLDYDLKQLDNGAELLALTGQSEKEIEKLLQSIGVGEEPEQPTEPEPDETKDDKLTFAIAKDQRPTIEQALTVAKQLNNIPHTNLDNINGTALYYICQYYVENQESHNIEASPAPSDPAPISPELTSIPGTAAN